MTDNATSRAANRLALLAQLHRPVDAYLCASQDCHDNDHNLFEAAESGDWQCVTCTLDDGGPVKVCSECRTDDGDPAEWPTMTDELLIDADADTDEDGDIFLKSFEVKDGKIELSVDTTGEIDEGLTVLLDHMGDMLDAHEVENYLEFELKRRSKRPICVCVRWMGHPTPHEFRVQAERERDALAEELDRWKNTADADFPETITEATEALERVEALAERLDSQIGLVSGEPDPVAQAFALEIRTAIKG